MFLGMYWSSPWWILYTIFSEPPVISAGMPSNTSIIENQRLTLACPATGTPLPVITWYKENIELTGNELGVRLLSDGSVQLDAVQAEDAGLYKCIATNIAGNHSHIVELSVYCKYFISTWYAFSCLKKMCMYFISLQQHRQLKFTLNPSGFETIMY